MVLHFSLHYNLRILYSFILTGNISFQLNTIYGVLSILFDVVLSMYLEERNYI